MKWLEISIILESEFVEAVADALSHYAHQGVAVEPVADNSARVRAYLPANDDPILETTRARLEQELFGLSVIHPIPPPTYTSIEDDDWLEIWTGRHQPVRYGERLVVIPAWLNPPLAPTDIPVWIDPGLAFGSGLHPTTQLCLDLLATYVKPGDRALDLGCGTGILAVAAARLGAASALAVDFAKVAGDATLHNAALNGVADKIEFRLGSLDVVLHPNNELPITNYQIVIANLLAEIIFDFLKQGLPQIISPEGIFIVSGILPQHTQSVAAALNTAGFEVVQTHPGEEWVALAAKRVSTYTLPA